MHQYIERKTYSMLLKLVKSGHKKENISANSFIYVLEKLILNSKKKNIYISDKIYIWLTHIAAINNHIHLNSEI